MADEKPQKSAASRQGGSEGQNASGDPATREALDATRSEREQADEQKGGTRVPLPDQDSPTVVTATQTLAGVEPAGVRQAGGADAHAELVAGDQYAYDSVPGAQGVEAVGSGTPVPESAQQAMRDRANAGIPEVPKVGPVQNVSLYDTPGGFQTVPAGFTPEDLVSQTGSTLAPRSGQAVRRPFGEEAGAQNLHVGGAAPGQRVSQAE